MHGHSITAKERRSHTQVTGSIKLCFLQFCLQPLCDMRDQHFHAMWSEELLSNELHSAVPPPLSMQYRGQLLMHFCETKPYKMFTICKMKPGTNYNFKEALQIVATYLHMLLASMKEKKVIPQL